MQEHASSPTAPRSHGQLRATTPPRTTHSRRTRPHRLIPCLHHVSKSEIPRSRRPRSGSTTVPCSASCCSLHHSDHTHCEARPANRGSTAAWRPETVQRRPTSMASAAYRKWRFVGDTSCLALPWLLLRKPSVQAEPAFAVQGTGAGWAADRVRKV